MPEKIDCAVIGAGVVGLAVARELALAGREVIILEAGDAIGTQTSSRNSEVIHAGIYYPTDSLKARLCVRGKQLLYELGERAGVPHRRTGKLIVAMQADEVPELERLLERGRRNGVELTLVGAEASGRLEPAVPAVAALVSPTTGIVSAHGLMDALLHEARRHGAILQPRAELVGIERRDRDYRLEIRTPDGTETLTSERVVNAAGLDSDHVAALAGIDVA